MKWIVGLDLRPSSQGAIAFASWLSKHAHSAEQEVFVGVHVLEEDHLHAVLRYHHLAEVVAGARKDCDRVLADGGVAQVFAEPQVVQGRSAERSLEAARVYHHADGLIVGRQAGSDELALVRLGRVARRVLRSLEAPVVVVPPDLTEQSIGEGPVVALTNLSDDGVQACRVAAMFAARLGRDLILLHVLPLPDAYGAQYLPAESLARLRADHEASGRAAMATWAQAHGFSPEVLRLEQGLVTDRALAFAKDQGACLLVTGSRRLGVLDRVLLTSHGSELAGSAAMPVMVVPPAGS
jgi:nucleotide-binding universal stress UspA family protein